MAIPDATQTVLDGALGVVAGNDGDNVSALIGTCSLGTINTVYQFTDITTLRATLGSGALVEAAAYVLAVAGGSVVCVKAPSTAGSNSAVSAGGSNTGASVMTLTGTPLDAYLLKVLIVTGGANPAAGVATFKYSLDGGRTYSSELSLPTAGTYLMPNTGVTLNFSAASLVAADTYTATSTGPSYSVSEMNTAIDALLADATTQWFTVHPVGIPADSDAALSIEGALETKMALAASSQYRYVCALFQLYDGSDSAIKATVLALANTRIWAAAGFEYLTSPINGTQYKRPAAWVALARAASVPMQEDLGRVRTGAVVGVGALLRDEFKTPGLDAARITTLRTMVGKQGYYVTSGRMLAPVGSDFTYLQHRRVMDKASKTVRAAMLNWLNDDVLVDKVTGLIFEEDAVSIEQDIEGQLRAEVVQPGRASNCTVQLDRTVNILSTSKLVIRFRVTPRGYIKSIESEIGFENPALRLI